MAADESYNGWKNYPTWCVNLWLSNDEGLEQATRELVADALEGAPVSMATGEKMERYAVSTALRQFVSEDESGLVPDLGATFAADLLGYALDLVDWHEIADAWIESATEVEA